MNKEQIIANIRNLGFCQKETIHALAHCIEQDESIMPALKSLVKIAKTKDYELTLSQVAAIALSQYSTQNLLAYEKYYPMLKKMSFDIKMLLNIIKIHAPYVIFPILVETIPELKEKNWSYKSIQKIFCFSQNINKLDVLKKYFFQLKAWHLSKIQIEYMIENYTSQQIETWVSNVHHLLNKGYVIANLIELTYQYGLNHLNTLEYLSHSKIPNFFTRNEIMSMINRPEGPEIINALVYNYTDLATMGYNAIKIKSIILQEFNQPQSFVQKNMGEFDTYLNEMYHDRQQWFLHETYSIFASKEEVDERFAMYREDLESKKQAQII